MSELIATTQQNSAYKEVSPGMHSARCVRVIDLGTQKQEFNGEISYKRQVLIIWEVPEEMHNEMPLTISKFYTLSLHEKSNLGADLTSWRGRAFKSVLPQIHPSLFFSLDEFQKGNKEIFEELSDGICNIILRSKELEGADIDMGDGNNGVDLESNDVPF